MARSRKRPYNQPHRPLNMGSLASLPRQVDVRGGDSYSMHYVSGSTKTYTCPGCHHPIAPGTKHVVAWATQTAYWNDSGVDSRRHWHSACWRRDMG